MHLFTIWTNGNASKIAFHSKFHKGTNKTFLIFEHWPNVFKFFKPILGHFWLNSVNNDFKICGITIKAIVQTYQSVKLGPSMMGFFLVLQWRILAFKLPVLFHIPYARHHKPLLITSRSRIQAIHKDRIFLKNLLGNKEMVF